MTQNRTVIDEFTHKLGLVAERWSDKKTELIKPPGTVEAFEEAAVLALIKATSKDKRLQCFDKGNVQRGIETIARFNYMSALALHRAGITDVNQASSVLRDPKSFSCMDYLARQHPQVASEVEHAQGLSRGMASADYVVVRDGAIDMLGLDEQVAMQMRIYSQSNDYNDEEPKGCFAQRAECLEPIYQHIVTIGLKDPSLTAAVLAMQKRPKIANGS